MDVLPLRVLWSLGRLLLGLLLLGLLLLLILVIILLLYSGVLVQLGVGDLGAWRALGVEGLVFVRVLAVLDGRVVALVLLRVLLWR